MLFAQEGHAVWVRESVLCRAVLFPSLASSHFHPRCLSIPHPQTLLAIQHPKVGGGGGRGARPPSPGAALAMPCNGISLKG